VSLSRCFIIFFFGYHTCRVGELERDFGPVAALQGRVESVEKGVGPVLLLRERVGVVEEGLGPVLTRKRQEEIREGTVESFERSVEELTSRMINLQKVIEEGLRDAEDGSERR